MSRIPSNSPSNSPSTNKPDAGGASNKKEPSATDAGKDKAPDSKDIDGKRGPDPDASKSGKAQKAFDNVNTGVTTTTNAANAYNQTGTSNSSNQAPSGNESTGAHGKNGGSQQSSGLKQEEQAQYLGPTANRAVKNSDVVSGFTAAPKESLSAMFALLAKVLQNVLPSSQPKSTNEGSIQISITSTAKKAGDI